MRYLVIIICIHIGENMHAPIFADYTTWHSSLPEICIFPFTVVEYSWLESCRSYSPEVFAISGAVQRSILQRCEPATTNTLHTKIKQVMIFRRFSILAERYFAQTTADSSRLEFFLGISIGLGRLVLYYSLSTYEKHLWSKITNSSQIALSRLRREYTLPPSTRIVSITHARANDFMAHA